MRQVQVTGSRQKSRSILPGLQVHVSDNIGPEQGKPRGPQDPNFEAFSRDVASHSLRIPKALGSFKMLQK